jgi:DNA polymerase-4
MNERRIAHLDMDAFYASVELLRYPELKGQPVAIGGRSDSQPELLPNGTRRFARLRDYVGRGVLTTATYEARALGVHSGMGTMKAAKLAPDVILLPVDFDAYRHYSRLFKAAVARIVPNIEDRGIDEIYLDLSQLPGTRLELAQSLKQAVRTATGLSCSIGIAPNKLLAKICSDLNKPDGITLLALDELPTRIWPLPVRKINGIGPKADAKLALLGIHTIGELAAADPLELIAHFGNSYGTWLHQAAHGIDERPLVIHSTPKSISRETTFGSDLHPHHDRNALGRIFTALCERVAADLQRKHLVARTIGIKLRYDDFHTVTRDLTLSAHTADAQQIRHAAGNCLKRVPLERRLRLLGVRASALQPDTPPPTRPAPLQGELPLPFPSE